MISLVNNRQTKRVIMASKICVIGKLEAGSVTRTQRKRNDVGSDRYEPKWKSQNESCKSLEARNAIGKPRNGYGMEGEHRSVLHGFPHC